MHCYAQHKEFFVAHYNSENGLPQNSIKGLEIDSKGFVWLATEAGLVRFDGTNFKLYNRTSSGGYINKRIDVLNLSKDDAISFRVEGLRYYKVSKQNFPEEFIPNDKERTAHEKKSGERLYEFYDKCIYQTKANKWPAWILPDIKVLFASNVNGLALLNNRYYYFNEKREVVSVDTSFRDFKKIILHGFEAIKFSDPRLHPVSLLQKGDKLFLRWGESVYETSFSEDMGHIYGHIVVKIGAMSNVTTFASYKNLFFIGTLSDGLYVFKNPDFSTLRFERDELNVFYAQAPFDENAVLTDKGVLPESTGRRFAGYDPRAILKTKEGHYLLIRWVSPEISGISELDSNLKEINFISCFNLHVSCMFQMKNGSIWIGREQRFLGRIENKSIVWMSVPAVLDTFQIKTIEECSTDELWVAGNKGLAQINVKTGKYKIYPEFANLTIRDLHQDAKGVLWISTYGGGFYAYYKGKAIKMPLDRESYLLNVHAFLEDRNGYCWMPTNQGLFQAKMSDLYDYIDKKTSSIYYHYYDRSSGFLTNEFNGGASPPAVRLNNGMFSLPSMNGLVQFNPERIQPVLSTNSIYIDAVLADTSILDPTQDHFVFSNKMNQLQISISSPFLGTPYNHFMQYRLNGLDTSWIPVSSKGVLMFNHLPKGDYELVLRKQSGFGNSIIEKHLSFTVQPSFYETWAFKLLIGLLLLGLMFLLFGLRVRILLHQRKRLENEVTERTKEQVLLIDDLETTVKELELSREQLFQNKVFMEKLAMIITHDLQSPLRFLSDASGRASVMAKESHQHPLAELNSEIKKSSANVHHFVENFGLWIRTFGKNFQVKEEPFLLIDLIEQLQQFFSELLKMKGNKLHIQSDKQLLIRTDRQLLLIVIRNLVDNANKYTHHGSIDIDVSVINSDVTISIKDTGSGIRPAELERLRKLINQPLPGFSKEPDVGYGYQFVADFCKLLNIALEINTGENAGTEIRLSNIKKG